MQYNKVNTKKIEKILKIVLTNELQLDIIKSSKETNERKQSKEEIPPEREGTNS